MHTEPQDRVVVEAAGVGEPPWRPATAWSPQGVGAVPDRIAREACTQRADPVQATT
jgi:hypothetical protein